ncbi:hypothetical protein [Altericroceibacterium xinjiangense]|uniref:hypothetical protein n=1 Tax=Altericroceibacterium xinjiangense TaxID=762261 RepID=UPI000F7E19AF|nr:hypothetical protein [Altericroceibacterium xinjiangense]
MWLRVHVAEWETPYRQLIYWFVAALAFFVAISTVLWFGGFAGVPFAFLAAFVLVVSWLILLLLGLKAAWVRRREPRKALCAGAAPVGAFGLALALALPTTWAVAWAFDWAFFLSNHASYREVVRLTEEGRFDASVGEHQEHEGIMFLLDAGPPRRVAFPMPGGFLDNWSGLIYDPTGEVMLADGFDSETGEFAAPERITKLFYGDIVSCRHMLDSFYNCSFT